MSSLKLDVSKCIRTVTKFSNCTKCVDICPVKTIQIANNLPAFTPLECVDCGGCLGVCPSEALTLKNFDVTEFFFEFAVSKEELISCYINVPCIMALSVEHLISLALVKPDPIILDIGHCENCPYKETLYENILKNVDEANYILEACNSGKIIRLEEIAAKKEDLEESVDVNERRIFLKHFSLKGAIKAKKEFKDVVDSIDDEIKFHTIDIVDVAKIRQKEIPNKRKILFVALKKANKPSVYHTIAEDSISFVSQKFIDTKTCTNCQMCYRICPTGALSSDAKNSKIYFDTMLCIKCHTCHDTCEPNSLKLQPTFEIKEFFEPTQRLLISFKIIYCDECSIAFTSLNGETICPRCAIEEKEALELWDLEEKPDGIVWFKQNDR